MQIFPLKIGRKNKKFDICHELCLTNFDFKDGDIIIISSKFLSISEGRILGLEDIRKISTISEIFGKKYFVSPKIMEVILREADLIFNGVPGFLLTIKDGIIAPNAGIDKSNIDRGRIVLYPSDPFELAENIRREFLYIQGKKIGIVVSDSRLMPTRIGTTGIAIACSGIDPIEDNRGKKDLYGNILKVTIKAVADMLATFGVYIMGESDESTPVVVIRDSKIKMTDQKVSVSDFVVDPEIDIYARTFTNKRNTVYKNHSVLI
ncbi:MAG: cytidine deaminase [Nitrososphaeraceae archaeon]|nr:cytidine deaminase [Nitrososphaeraceae archaeon]